MTHHCRVGSKALRCQDLAPSSTSRSEEYRKNGYGFVSGWHLAETCRQNATKTCMCCPHTHTHTHTHTLQQTCLSLHSFRKKGHTRRIARLPASLDPLKGSVSSPLRGQPPHPQQTLGPKTYPLSTNLSSVFSTRSSFFKSFSVAPNSPRQPGAASASAHHPLPDSRSSLAAVGA